VGLIALMLVGGLALASCGTKCPRDGDCFQSILRNDANTNWVIDKKRCGSSKCGFQNYVKRKTTVQ
jgi:hypothetical protein